MPSRYCTVNIGETIEIRSIIIPSTLKCFASIADYFLSPFIFYAEIFHSIIIITTFLVPRATQIGQKGINNLNIEDVRIIISAD